jgi:hypothetical protein
VSKFIKSHFETARIFSKMWEGGIKRSNKTTLRTTSLENHTFVGTQIWMAPHLTFVSVFWNYLIISFFSPKSTWRQWLVGNTSVFKVPIMPCNLVGTNLHFERTCCHLLPWTLIQPTKLHAVLYQEAICAYETSCFPQSIWCCNPEGRTLCPPLSFPINESQVVPILTTILITNHH